MSFFLLARESDGTLTLLSTSAFETQDEALTELSRLTASPAFSAWDAQVFVAALDDAVPVLLVRPSAAAEPAAEVARDEEPPIPGEELPFALELSVVEDVGTDAEVEETESVLDAYDLDIEEPAVAADLEATDDEQPTSDGSADVLPHTDELIAVAAATLATETATEETEPPFLAEEPPAIDEVVAEPAAETEAEPLPEAEIPAEPEVTAELGAEVEPEPEPAVPEPEAQVFAEPEVTPEPEPLEIASEPEGPAEDDVSDGIVADTAEESDASDQGEEAQVVATVAAPTWPWSAPIELAEPDEVEADSVVDDGRDGVEQPDAGSDAADEASSESPHSDLGEAPAAEEMPEDLDNPETSAETEVLETAADVEPESAEEPEAPAPEGYRPSGGTLDELTCEDCIYVDTCPSSGDRLPSACGTFQWK